MKIRPMCLVLATSIALAASVGAIGLASTPDPGVACEPDVAEATGPGRTRSSTRPPIDDATIGNDCASQDAFTIAAEATPPTASLAEARAIVAGMKPGEFRAVGKNTQLSVAPSAAESIYLVQAPYAVMNSWGAAAFDRKRNVLIVQGGGHGDYCGNEVYEFPLATLAWGRATNPSPVRLRAGTDGIYETIDGSEAPISFHGYDGMQYIPDTDEVFVLPAASCSSGNTYDAYAYRLSRATNTWKRGAKAPYGNPDMGCDWWEKGRKIVCSHYNGHVSYDPTANVWKVLQDWDDQSSGATAAIDQERQLLVQMGPNARVAGQERVPMVYYDLKDTRGPGENGPRRTPAPLTGNTDFRNVNQPGLEWHPATRRFVIWGGGPDVWAVDRSWNAVKYTGNGPAYLSDFPGVYGRWRYVPALDIFIGVRRGDEQVWLYKLPRPGEITGDETPAPTALPSRIIDSLQDGQTVELPEGDFVDTFVVRASNVVIKGPRTTLRNKSSEGGVATVVTRGRNVRIEGLTVRDAQGDATTACFGMMAGTLTLVEVDAEGCPQGIRTGKLDFTMKLTVLRSRFGPPRAAGQLQHNWYVDQIGELHAEDTDIVGCASGGHNLKSRARKTTFLRGRIAQLEHACGRAVDLSQGGANLISGTVIEHGRATDNPDVMGFAREGNVTDGVGHVFAEWPGVTVVDGVTIIVDWNNPAYRPCSHWSDCIAVTVGGDRHRAIVRNSRLVGPGDPWRAVWFSRVVGRRIGEDAGGNVVFKDRAAAGIPAYPALP